MFLDHDLKTYENQWGNNKKCACKRCQNKYVDSSRIANTMVARSFSVLLNLSQVPPLLMHVGKWLATLPVAKRSSHLAPDVDLGECTLHLPLPKVNKAEPTLALKPRGEVTRNPKWGTSGPKKDMCLLMHVGKWLATLPVAKRSSHLAPDVDLGECTLHLPLPKVNKAEPTLALKPRGEVTRNPKWGTSGPKKDMCLPKTVIW